MDGVVWILLATVSTSRLVISFENNKFWEFKGPFNQSILVRFFVNTAFFISAVIIDIMAESKSFSDYIPYYIGLFVFGNLMVFVSAAKLTGSYIITTAAVNSGYAHDSHVAE